MVTICRAYVRSGLEQISDDEIRGLGSRAYNLVESASTELLRVDSTSITVQVREGSLTVIGVITMAAAALYSALTRYDDFWSGVARIRGQAHSAAESLRKYFQTDRAFSGTDIVSSRISAGALDKLHRLHTNVKARALSPDAAVQEALRTFHTSGEPIDEQIISGVEEAFGASRVGLQRLSKLALESEAKVHGPAAPRQAALAVVYCEGAKKSGM